MNVPESCADVMKDISTEIHTQPQGRYTVVHLFVSRCEEIETLGRREAEALAGDGYLWISYP